MSNFSPTKNAYNLRTNQDMIILTPEMNRSYVFHRLETWLGCQSLDEWKVMKGKKIVIYENGQKIALCPVAQKLIIGFSSNFTIRIFVIHTIMLQNFNFEKYI